jgi:hypothetical protein
MTLLAELSQMLINGFRDVNKLRIVSFIDLLAESRTIYGKPQASCPFYSRLRIGSLLHYPRDAYRSSSTVLTT